MSSNKENESSPRGRVFDPWTIGPNHNEHSHLTNIIQLEESGAIFCPQCLESSPIDNVDKVKEGTLQQCFKNYFEALDQHTDNDRLRKIVLCCLERILKSRAVDIKNDHEFHNILRIIHKTMNSNKFTPSEFPSLAIILTNVTNRYINHNPIPVVSIWKAFSTMLNHAKKHITNSRHECIMVEESSFESTKFLTSLAIIIKVFLRIVKRFSIHRVPYLILPLYVDDDPATHNRVHYNECQMNCLKLMTNEVIPYSWKYLTLSTRALSEAERNMVGEIFEAFQECFSLSVRLDYKEFQEILIKKDCLMAAHALISNNRDFNFRKQLKEKFLKCFVLHYIELELGSDQGFKEFDASNDIVNTNYVNAISFSIDERYKKSIFYLLVNYVALKQSSKYFDSNKVSKVLKSVSPARLKLEKSIVFTKAYNYLVASVTKQSGRLKDDIEMYFIQRWRQMRDGQNQVRFVEEFCFDEVVFDWAKKDPNFAQLVNVSTIKCLVEIAIKNDRLSQILKPLLMDKRNSYKTHVVGFFKDEESAISAIEDIVKFDSLKTCSIPNYLLFKEAHKEIISHLTAILLTQLHSSVIRFDSSHGGSRLKKRIYRLTTMLVILLKNCRHFNPIFDDAFLKDITRLVEQLYEKKIRVGRYAGLLIVLNDFFAQLIETNSFGLMRLLKYIDFFMMGHMYFYLANCERGDLIAESIARFLLAYDNIDYPINHDLNINLYAATKSAIHWMLSGCNELHILSLKLVKKILSRTEEPKSAKLSVTTGLIHMLVAKPGILQNQIHLDIFLSLLELDELKYNPLLSRIFDAVPAPTRTMIERKMKLLNNLPLSPTISFDSSDDESSLFGEIENAYNIINQFGDISHVNPTRIPASLYVSETVRDHHSNEFFPEEWEKRAHDTTIDEI